MLVLLLFLLDVQVPLLYRLDMGAMVGMGSMVGMGILHMVIVAGIIEEAITGQAIDHQTDPIDQWADQ